MPVPTFQVTPDGSGYNLLQQIWFGGLTIPVIGGTLPWQNLNDRIGWSAVDSPIIDNQHIINKASPLAWRGRGVWTSQDFTGRKIRIHMVYDEACGVPFSTAKASLTQTGEQYLSFDGGVTGLRVRCDSFSESKFLTGFKDPTTGYYLHDVELIFLSRNPFMQAITQQQVAAVNVGSAAPTTMTPSYDGNALAFPQSIITMPANTPGVITSIYIGNNASGEIVGANILPPMGSSSTGPHTISINSIDQTFVVDGAHAFPPIGSFPNFYPGFPPPATNTFTCYINTQNGVHTSGMTWAMYWYPQYEI